MELLRIIDVYRVVHLLNVAMIESFRMHGRRLVIVMSSGRNIQCKDGENRDALVLLLGDLRTPGEEERDG